MTNNKQQTAVKLYTEEQVKMAIQMADKYNYLITLEECGILNQLTPIELPSDEEIEKESRFMDDILETVGFQAGSKFVIDRIQGGAQ